MQHNNCHCKCRARDNLLTNHWIALHTNIALYQKNWFGLYTSKNCIWLLSKYIACKCKGRDILLTNYCIDLYKALQHKVDSILYF